MSHTPGPWRQDGRLVFEPNLDAIAMVNIARPVDAAIADARLIAAAPDLLAACLAMDDAVCNGFTTKANRQQARQALISCRAAIAKATS